MTDEQYHREIHETLAESARIGLEACRAGLEMRQLMKEWAVESKQYMREAHEANQEIRRLLILYLREPQDFQERAKRLEAHLDDGWNDRRADFGDRHCGHGAGERMDLLDEHKG
jgi:hypothetical protein